MRKTDGIMGPVRLLAGLAATRCGGGATIVGSPSDLKTRLPTAEGMAPSPCDSRLGHPVRGETLDALAVSGPALPGGLLPTSTNDARQRAEWPWRASAAPKGEMIYSHLALAGSLGKRPRTLLTRTSSLNKPLAQRASLTTPIQPANVKAKPRAMATFSFFSSGPGDARGRRSKGCLTCRRRKVKCGMDAAIVVYRVCV